MEGEEDLLSALIDAFHSDDETEVPNQLPTENTASTAVDLSSKPVDENLNTSKPRKLEECDIFSSTENKTSLVEDLFGDEGSEPENDDELIAKTDLNSNGREISRIMKTHEKQSVTTSGFYDTKLTTSQIKNKWVNSNRTGTDATNSSGVTMPHLGFAIVNPKVSMQFLKQAFEEKEYIKLNKVNYKKAAASTDKDWITFGVVASKSETKRSNAGNSFIIFRLIDMANVDEEVSLFLFGNSYSTHWKLPPATIIGLMNPSIMSNDKYKGKCVPSLSVANQSQLMVVGTAKDFGTCGSVTKQGNKCTNFVNRALCSTCRFHTMQEHKLQSHRRSELNTTYASREPGSATRSRLMSKLSTSKSSEECIIYGGQSFSSKSKPKTNVSVKGVLNRSKQKGNLQSTLNLYQIKPEDQKRLEASKAASRSKADEKLEELLGRPSTASMQFMRHLMSKELKGSSTTKNPTSSVTQVKPAELIKQEKEKLLSRLQAKKTVSNHNGSSVSLNNFTSVKSAGTMTPQEYKQLVAKNKALAMVRQNGAIRKEDVNALRKNLTVKQKEQLKRTVDQSLDGESIPEHDSSGTKEKRPKLEQIDVNSEHYSQIRNKKSINSHLIKQVEDDRESQYFQTLERKESYETKLLGIHKIESKLFVCLQCDYQDWRLSDRCRQEGHKFKKLDVFKRFFKCNNCKERLTTHEKFPSVCCQKCGGRNFSKAGMINEKKVTLASDELCLRGSEEGKLGFYNKIDLNV